MCQTTAGLHPPLEHLSLLKVRHLFANGEFARLENSVQQQLPLAQLALMTECMKLEVRRICKEYMRTFLACCSVMFFRLQIRTSDLQPFKCEDISKSSR